MHLLADTPFVFCCKDVTRCLQSLGNASDWFWSHCRDLCDEGYHLTALNAIFYTEKGGKINEVWGTWLSLVTQIRIAEAEVSIKTLLVLIYNVIGRTRLYLQPRVVFTTFFCLLCSLRGSGYPHFMHFWNAITIVASSLQNSFSFLRSRSDKALQNTHLVWLSWPEMDLIGWVAAFLLPLLYNLWNSLVWSFKFCNTLTARLSKMK